MSLKPWEVQAQSTVIASENDARKNQYDGVTETLLQFWNINSIVVMVGIALPTGLFGGVLAFFAALAFGAPKPWWFLLIGGILSTIVMWGLIVFAFFFKMIFPQLNFMVIDKNHNGVPDRYEENLPITKVEVIHRNQNEEYIGISNLEIPATLDQMKTLAIGIIEMRKPFSEREWTGPGQPFSSGDGGTFRKFRAYCVKREMLTEVKKGETVVRYEWTDTGLETLKAFLPEQAFNGFDR